MALKGAWKAGCIGKPEKDLRQVIKLMAFALKLGL